MKNGITTLVVFFAISGSVRAAAEPPRPDFFVSPSGSDTNPGTREKPFATLTRAKDAVRKRVASGLKSDLTVLIREGTYALSAPLVFGPADSGTAQHSITYVAHTGEKVVISGGRKISGWRRGEGPVWEVDVPGVKDGTWYFRNLFVNGRRMVRARTPNHDAVPSCRQLAGVDLTEDRTRYTLTLPPGLLENWRNPSDIQVMIAGNWAINRKRVQSIDAAANVITLAPPHQHGPDYIFPRSGRWCYIENARELLDQPDEWFLDRRTGVLSYWPPDGVDMQLADTVAPVLEKLVEVRGTPKRPVRNLHFKGLRFEHTDWQLPPEGYMGIQACHYGKHEHPKKRWKHVPSAIGLTYAEQCSVQDCVIARLGGSGVEVSDGSRNNLIQGNHIFNISANGVMISGPNDEAVVPGGNRVRNNHVHACGLEYYGAIGIWVGYAQGTAIAHNLVHDLPYTGISVGWEWSPQPTPCKENLIELNHVYNVMNRLCDGGCIYTLGFQPGTIIRNNHLHGVHRSPLAQGAPNNGMFIDQGSKGYLFERNVIYNTRDELVRFNQCKREWHTWKENHLGDQAEVTEAGKEIIHAAGLEPRYRKRLVEDSP